MATSNAQFKKAVWLVRNGPKKDSSNDTKLLYYGLYKQATEGDVKGSQPWAVQVEARAKWDAWNELQGTSQAEAQQQYVQLLAKDDPQWEQHEAFKDYKP